MELSWTLPSQISHTSEEDAAVATEILKFYTDNGQVADLGPDNFQNITDMLTDSYFAFANHLFLKHHLKHSSATTYQYKLKLFDVCAEPRTALNNTNTHLPL